jgi:hypothetical protein
MGCQSMTGCQNMTLDSTSTVAMLILSNQVWCRCHFSSGGQSMWPFKSRKQEEPDEPIICTCEKCQAEYRIGENAIVTTLEEATGMLNRGKGFDVGKPSSTPDRVGRVPQADYSDAGYLVLRAARKAQQIRFWKCDCGHGQPYEWCREAAVERLRASLAARNKGS